MADRLLTPSKITAWLDCAHFLTFQHWVDRVGDVLGEFTTCSTRWAPT